MTGFTSPEASTFRLPTELLPDFGISTECGLGRHSAQQLLAVLVAWEQYAAAREPALAAG